ncbi:hypothetical protein [Blastococcus sp. SYSU D00820]
MSLCLPVLDGFVASVEVRRDGRQPGDLTHAVSRPVVDGLAASVCGVLVTAIADRDWHAPGSEPRCEECARLAG